MLAVVAFLIFTYKWNPLIVGQTTFPMIMAILAAMIAWEAPANSQGEAIGPAMMPYILAFILGSLSLTQLFKIFQRNDLERVRHDNLPRLLWLIGVAGLCVLFLEEFGFFICTFSLLFVTLNLAKVERLGLMIGISGAWTLFTYLVFYKLLSIQLPVGFLFESALGL
jgi:hypothetical protein